MNTEATDETTQDTPPEEPARPEHPLFDNPLRTRVYDAVKARPGMNTNQIGVELGLNPGVVNHHVDLLCDERILLRLDSVQGKEYLHFLPEHAHYWEDDLTRVLFGREPNRLVAMYIADHPGCITKEIAKALDVAPITVRQHLLVIRDHSLITSGRARHRVEYHPLKPLRDWMEQLSHHYPVPWRNGDGDTQ